MSDDDTYYLQEKKVELEDYNNKRRKPDNFRSSILLSCLSVVFVTVTVVPGDINQTGRTVAAFLAGMFGSAAIESIRRSY
jgi:hypothetical protein